MRNLKVLLIVSALLLLVPSSMWADTWTSNGYTFNVSATTGGTYGFYQVTITATNSNSTTGYWQGFSLKDMFGTLTQATVNSGPGTATAHIGFNNGSGNCSGNDQYSFCVDMGLGSAIGANGGSSTVVISLNGNGVLSSEDIWHLQTLVTDRMCSGVGCTGTDDRYTKTLVAISSTGTPTTQTPEPATMSMLASGLLGVGLLGRRKR